MLLSYVHRFRIQPQATTMRVITSALHRDSVFLFFCAAQLKSLNIASMYRSRLDGSTDGRMASVELKRGLVAIGNGLSGFCSSFRQHICVSVSVRVFADAECLARFHMYSPSFSNDEECIPLLFSGSWTTCCSQTTRSRNRWALETRDLRLEDGGWVQPHVPCQKLTDH